MTSRENFYEDWSNGILPSGTCHATESQCNGTAPCESQGRCDNIMHPLSCSYQSPKGNDTGGVGRCVHDSYNWYKQQYNSCPMFIKPTGQLDDKGNMTYCYGPNTVDKDSYTSTSVNIQNGFCGLGQTAPSKNCPQPGNPRNLCGSGPGVL